MGYLKYLFACIVVMFLCIQQGYSLSCYVCNSHNNGSCADNVPPEKYKQACSSSDLLCRKIKQVIDFEVNGLHAETRIIRSCGYFNKSLTNYCYQRSGFGGRQEVCACDSDNCNASSAIVASSSLIVALYVLMKITH